MTVHKIISISLKVNRSKIKIKNKKSISIHTHASTNMKHVQLNSKLKQGIDGNAIISIKTSIRIGKDKNIRVTSGIQQ